MTTGINGQLWSNRKANIQQKSHFFWLTKKSQKLAMTKKYTVCGHCTAAHLTQEQPGKEPKAAAPASKLPWSLSTHGMHQTKILLNGGPTLQPTKYLLPMNWCQTPQHGPRGLVKSCPRGQSCPDGTRGTYSTQYRTFHLFCAKLKINPPKNTPWLLRSCLANN